MPVEEEEVVVLIVITLTFPTRDAAAGDISSG
jgi:hypothetical protein